ncbi:MAG: hypothetical protein ACRDPO_29490 [Streptosporangiaceae bacterium]
MAILDTLLSIEEKLNDVTNPAGTDPSRKLSDLAASAARPLAAKR